MKEDNNMDKEDIDKRDEVMKKDKEIIKDKNEKKEEVKQNNSNKNSKKEVSQETRQENKGISKSDVETKENDSDVKKIEKNSNEKKKSFFVIMTVSIIAIILIILSVIFALININNEKILEDISIMGIDVGNMTQEEAKSAVEEVVNKKLEEELVLKKDDYETSMTAQQINSTFDIDTAVSEAYNIGRDGNIVTNNYGILFTWIFGKDIDCNLNYNEESLNKKIEDVSSKLPDSVVQSSYYIEDENLIIVKGKDGLKIKNDELKSEIIEQISNINEKYSIINIPTEETKPDDINLEEIRNEIYKEPQDAYVSKNEETGKTEVHTEVNGVDFAISMEEAGEILSKDKDEYTIPLEITIPENTLEDLGEEAFPDELGTYTTRYDPSNKNRSNNLAISAEKIDGTIVLPGETFSYNQIVGERTIVEGYKEAGAYAGGRVVQDVGGGICQTSSTLYNAALYANLEIVDRSNHQFLTSYVSAGRDATVAWGSIDFKFKNNRSYPIKIEATAKNGVCTMSIYGIKEETEYEVVIQSVVLSYIPYTTKYENDSSLAEGEEVVEQSGYTGCTSEAYKILKLNGEIVSKTLLSKDTYDPMTRIIRRGTKKEETEETSTADNIEDNNKTEVINDTADE